MLLLLAIVGLASATCYLANGTADSAPYIAQCPSNFGTQMCCWLVNLPNPDSCTTRGICLSNYISDDSRKYVDGCTDPDWGSGCSPLGKLCPSNTAGYVEVTTCSDGSVCCGDSNSPCCNDGQGYRIDAKGQVQGSPVTTTAESSTTASSIPSQSSANNQSDGNNNLSKKQTVAISVAIPTVGVGVALLAWWRPRRPR